MSSTAPFKYTGLLTSYEFISLQLLRNLSGCAERTAVATEKSVRLLRMILEKVTVVKPDHSPVSFQLSLEDGPEPV